MIKKLFSVILMAATIFSCSAFFCEQSEAARMAAYSEATVINVSKYVNLRENPSSNSAVLAKVPLGATVEVSGEKLPEMNNGFYYVNYRGIFGYIHSKYLTTPW